MLFDSFAYTLAFLPLTVLACASIRKVWGARAAQASVLAISLLFYVSWGVRFLPFLVASIVANWLLGRLIGTSQGRVRSAWLRFGVAANVLYLAFFKYINLLLSSIPFFAHRHISLPDLPFPLGISFFTLSQIMYLVDRYQQVAETHTLFDHATFVSFFPYVISGPIPRAKRMLHQFGNFGLATESRSDLVGRGIQLFSMGLFKKVVLSDGYAEMADFGFSLASVHPFNASPQPHFSGLEALIFGAFYTFQLYFDFSGYSDMAIGSALMLGIEIPRNFDAPLRSKSIIEFWQRWHISLSEFITSYLYTPLLRSFPAVNLVTACIATLVAMSIAGLWHGPAWKYVVFGALHGLGLCINQVWRKKKFPKLPKMLSWALTFLLVDIAFIFFRSDTIPSAFSMLQPLFHLQSFLGWSALRHFHGTLQSHVYGKIVLALAVSATAALALAGPSSESLSRDFRPTRFSAALSVALIAISWAFLTNAAAHQFVYFKF